MVAKFGSSKNVFWEAFIIAGAFFVLGILLGIVFESGRVQNINRFYEDSEIALKDSATLNNLISSGEYNCEIGISAYSNFADRIYKEAKLLERYDNAEKINDELKTAHRKYSLLRTILWINFIEARKECPTEINSVVYLYNYETQDLAERATNSVWSKILSDLKQEKGNDLILIPIAVDSDLVSLNLLIEELNISNFPAIIINEQEAIYEISSSKEISELLN